jgi:hypothetical protein
MCRLTTSPMLTMPRRTPSATTGDVPDAPLGHDPHQLGHGDVGPHRVDVDGADLQDRLLQDRGTALVPRPHDVALAHDALDRRAVGRDDRCADAALGQDGQQPCDVAVGGDADHVGALGRQHFGDAHAAS